MFLILLVALYIPPFVWIIAGGGIHKTPYAVFALMWVPALSAIGTKLVCDRNLYGLGMKPGKLRYIGLSYAIPLFGGGIVYAFAWITQIGGLNREIAGMLPPFYWIGVIGIPMSILSAFGEELGWRGFLVPALAENYSYGKTSLLMAVIWNVYHYPILLFGDYNNGVSVVLSLLFFSISVTGICFITTWIRLKSGSVWGPVLLHATHNYYIQNVFDLITDEKPLTSLFTTEFGVGLAIVYAVVAYLFWRKRDALKGDAKENAA